MTLAPEKLIGEKLIGEKLIGGKLIGVGVGPGDPELLTLKAARHIETAHVIAYLHADGAPSFARRIAAAHIPETTEEVAISMPMASDRRQGQAVYDEASERVADFLEQGKTVVMLCEGDPFLYGSFMYVFARLRHRYDCAVVPGISSITAGPGVGHMPIAARTDVFSVIPATVTEDALSEAVAACDAAVILKVGRHMEKVSAVLQRYNLLDNALLVVRATLPDQWVGPLMQYQEMPHEDGKHKNGQASSASSVPYFSLIYFHKGVPLWT